MEEACWLGIRNCEKSVNVPVCPSTDQDYMANGRVSCQARMLERVLHTSAPLRLAGSGCVGVVAVVVCAHDVGG